MRKVLIFTLALSACASFPKEPGSRDPAAKSFVMGEDFDLGRLQSEIWNSVPRRPLTIDQLKKSSWEGMYRKRLAAGYCDREIGRQVKGGGEKIVNGPEGRTFTDSHAWLEGDPAAEPIKSWIENENTFAFRFIGCGESHKKIWYSILETLKKEAPSEITFQDVWADTLLSSWYTESLQEDGSELRTEYEGLRKKKKEGAKKGPEGSGPGQVKIPGWIRTFLSPEQAEVVEEIRQLAVNVHFVRFSESSGDHAGGLVLHTSDRKTDELPMGSYIMCPVYRCSMTVLKNKIFYYGYGFVDGKWQTGILELDTSTRVPRMVAPVDINEFTKISPAVIRSEPKEGAVLYRIAFLNEIKDLTLRNGSLQVSASVPLKIPGANIRRIFWEKSSELMGLGLKGTKSFLWKMTNPFDQLNPGYKEWFPEKHSNFLYTMYDGKKRRIIVGADGQSNLVAYTLGQNDRLVQVFNGGPGSSYRMELHYATASDGHKVPLVVKYKEGIDPASGKNPVLLYGYGGFGSATAVPGFWYDSRMYLDRGYVMVLPAQRGGPEIGPDEEEAGHGIGRAKNYEDMLAGARYVIEKGWTPKGKLLMSGASNGGLLVLRTVMAEPELFGAVYARSPVTDMLRFVEIDPSGLFWASKNYGNPLAEGAVFDFWMKNGPLQMVHSSRPLPPVLIRTGLGDLNVKPAHAFKMQQALKEKARGGPFLLYSGPMEWVHYPITARDYLEEVSYEMMFFESFGLRQR